MATELELIVGLVPGQGAYRPGCLRDHWTREEQSVRGVFDAVDDVAAELIGEKLSSRIFSGRAPTVDEMLVESPDLLQLAIFGLSVAAFRLLEAASVTFSTLVGHSLGEIAALVCAGALTVQQGAMIISHRCAALRKFAPPDSLMMAIQCDRAKVDQILDLFGSSHPLAVAVENSPRQTVISGPASHVRVVESIASALDIRATALRAPYAFHHPLLAKASRDWIARIGPQRQDALKTPVYSPILRRYYRDCDDLVSLLGLHLVSPVMFGATVDALHRGGASVFVELGASSALTGSVLASHPEATALRALDGSDERLSIARVVEFLAPPLGTSLPTQISRHVSRTISLDESVGVVDQLARTPDKLPAPLPSARAVAGATGRISAVPSPRAAAEPVGAPSRDIVLEDVRALYAKELEYPEEVFAEDVKLEADLGIDSLKQSEMFLKLQRRYNLDLPSVDASLWAIDTFGKVIDFVYTELAESAVK